MAHAFVLRSSGRSRHKSAEEPRPRKRERSEEDRAHLNISNGMVRLSVGLEDCEDLLEDLNQALKVMQCT